MWLVGWQRKVWEAGRADSGGGWLLIARYFTMTCSWIVTNNAAHIAAILSDGFLGWICGIRFVRGYDACISYLICFHAVKGLCCF